MIKRRGFLQFSTAAISGLVLPCLALGQGKALGHWSALANMPYAVQEIYPALLAGQIHIVGGFTPGEKSVAPTDRHIQYNIASNQWRELAPLPAARHHPQLVACQGILYALGGFGVTDSGQWAMQKQSWQYNAANNTWQETTAAPEMHAETVAGVIDSAIHIVGGRTPTSQSNASWLDHSDSKRHLLFDVSTKTWSQAAPALNARNSAAGAVINGQLYVVGGRRTSGGNADHLEVYDPAEDRWRLAAPLPQAQGGLAAAAINGQLIAFGGEFFGKDGFGVYSNTWCYNPERDQWSAVTAMKTPRHGLGAVGDGNAVYTMGGATGVATRGTSAVVEKLSF